MTSAQTNVINEFNQTVKLKLDELRSVFDALNTLISEIDTLKAKTGMAQEELTQNITQLADKYSRLKNSSKATKESIKTQPLQTVQPVSRPISTQTTQSENPVITTPSSHEMTDEEKAFSISKFFSPKVN